MSRLTRKDEHIAAALRLTARPAESGFNDVALVHNALPETGPEEIFLETELFGKKLAAPLLINAITGGGHIPGQVNRALAVAARDTGLAMAVGSQTVAADNPQCADSFKIVRRVNPDGLIIANVGAGVPVEAARRAVEMIEADALQVHLNVPQETVMREGDRDFRGWLDNIASMVRMVEVPVIVKEVGFGLSRGVVRRLSSAGVKYFDIGGKGGTNFIAIEDRRGSLNRHCLESWGIPTVASLVEVVESGAAELIIATGGVRNGLDAAKALALGAGAVGMAGQCLQVLFERGIDGLVSWLTGIKSDLRTVMHMLGVIRPGNLRDVPVVITGRTREWLAERGIDTAKYARRSEP